MKLSLPIKQKYEQSFAFQDIDKGTVLALCFQVMKDLQLGIFSGGVGALIGTTPNYWNSQGQKITCRIEGDELFISSEMMDAKVADMDGENKRNVQDFILFFGHVQGATNVQTLQNNKDAIQSLKEYAFNGPEQQPAEPGAKSARVKLSLSHLNVTYLLVIVNVLVFILMTVGGAGVVEPNSLVFIRWGSDFTPLTLSGDWWRLLSSMFIHFGIAHLAMNMYCLYTVGVYVEPMLGKAGYLVAYLSTGIIANLVSLWWHFEGTNGAGASGAVFGIYGIFLAMLTNSLITKEESQPLLHNIIIFVVYNLIFGMESGIDNSAHVGGLLSGIVFGYLYVYKLKTERHLELKIPWITPGILITTIIVAVAYLKQNRLPESARTSIINELQLASFASNGGSVDIINVFYQIHNSIEKITRDPTVKKKELVERIDKIALLQIKLGEQIMNTRNNYLSSPVSNKNITKIIQYLKLRRRELMALREIAQTENTSNLTIYLDKIRKEVHAAFIEIIKGQ